MTAHSNFLSESGLDALFNPKVMVIIGASRDPHKWGNRVLDYTRQAGFSGSLYGVNPAARAGDDMSGAQLVPNLAAVSEPIDLALIALPASATLSAVESCAAAGVRAAVLAASGFGELGVDGREVEQRIRFAAAASGMRLLGPNGFGLFVAGSGINLTPHEKIAGGSVALAAQSGNVAFAVFGEAQRAGLGFSACLGIGNQIDVGFGELLSYFAADGNSDAVALYVEGLAKSDGPAFRDGLAACRAAGKAVVVLKAGRSARGAHAAATHTGALAADDRVWQAVLDDGGAIRAESTQHLVDVLAAVTWLPRTSGRALVLTDGGGDSVMAVDALTEAGLPLAKLSETTRAALKDLVPPQAPRVPEGNPVTLDTAGGLQDDPRLLARCVRAAAADPGVDIVIIGGIFGSYTDLRSEELACTDELIAMRDQGIPLVVQSAYADDHVEPIERLRQAAIPVYPTVQRLVAALAHQTDGTVIFQSAESTAAAGRIGESAPLLPLPTTASLIAAQGITLPPLFVVASWDELVATAGSFRYPACLKIADPAVSHKSDVGGVVLGLSDDTSLIAAAAAMWQKFPDSPLVVMPMLDAGLELLAGAITDPVFGPLVMIGRGGVFAEVDPDVVLRLAPIDIDQARQALLALRCAPQLVGGRGGPAIDLTAMATLIVSLSELVTSRPGLSVEINPVLAYPRGYAVADLRATETNTDDTQIVASRKGMVEN